MMELSARYGDVFTVYMGSKPSVMLTHYKTIKEALLTNSDSLLARPEESTFPYTDREKGEYSKTYERRLT